MPILKLEECVEILKSGGVVAFPTETVYGLGADATNKTAIQKVYKAKNRPADNPLICHFWSIEQIQEYMVNIPEQAKILLKHFSPGPISLLLDLPSDSPLLSATCGKTQVICRIPNHSLTLELIQKVNKPLVGPSANISMRPSGTNPNMILEQFEDSIDGILDGGNSAIGLESTIIDALEVGIIKILRLGAIGPVEILAAFEKENMTVNVEYQTKTDSTVPGNKYPHYSPQTKVLKISDFNQIPVQPKNSKVVILASAENLTKFDQQNFEVINLGSLLDLESIAQNLYKNLQKIDSLNVEKAYLLEEDWGNSSLGLALKNRISKVGENT